MEVKRTSFKYIFNKCERGFPIAMGKFNKWKWLFPIIIFSVIGAAGCSGNKSDQVKNSSAKLTILSLAKIAAPFRPIAKTLLETSNFPVYLPAYLPPTPDQRMEWLLNLDNLDVSKNKFGIEIDEGQPGAKGGIYAGTLSGNIENHQGPPIVEQIINESKTFLMELKVRNTLRTVILKG